jgi:hypothetical protein
VWSDWSFVSGILVVSWLNNLHLIELVQDRLFEALVAQDVRLEPPRQILSDLVLHVSASWNSKYVVELLKSTLLSFGHPEETVAGQLWKFRVSIVDRLTS